MQEQSITEQVKSYAQQAVQWWQNRAQQAQEQQAAIQTATGGQVVRTYKGQKALTAGIYAMQQQGYHVATQSSYQPRAGCMRILMLGGIGALVFKPQVKFVVTFVR